MGLVPSAEGLQAAKALQGGEAANGKACRPSVPSHLFEHREWPTKGHEQHQPGHGPQRVPTDNRVRVGIYIPTSLIVLELCDDNGGHRSGIGSQRRRVSRLPRHQGELDTTGRRIRLLSSAENDASWASFYFSEVAGLSVSGYLVKFRGA